MYRSFPYSYYPGFYSPRDGYAQALAEEQAAREQYLNALQQQQEARDRAARARLARQAYDRSPYNSYLSSSDDDDDLLNSLSSPYSSSYYDTTTSLPRGLGAYGLSPQQRRALFEDQRRKELLEMQKAQERERLMQMVEEERKKQLMEEELRRRIREEERQRRVREEEELRRKILQEEQAKADQEELRQQRLGELEQLYRDLGFRTTARSQPTEPVSTSRRRRRPGSQIDYFVQPFRRARTMSPPHRQPSPQAKPTSIKVTTPEPSSSTTGHQSERAPTPKPPQPAYSAEQVSAVTKIQNFYRSHFPRFKSLKILSSLQATFDSLKSSFVLPANLDFKLDSSISSDNILTIPTHSIPLPSSSSHDDVPSIPSLAYTPTNAPLHQYYEELNRLLTKLDEVESFGDRSVRDRRRELARLVEREAERVDQWKVAVWRARENTGKDTAEVEDTMPVDVLPPTESIPSRLDTSDAEHLAEGPEQSSPLAMPMPTIPSEDFTPPPQTPEQLPSLTRPDVSILPPPPSSDIAELPHPDLPTSEVDETIETPLTNLSPDVFTEIVPPADDDNITTHLTTPAGEHLSLDTSEDDDVLSDSETVVHSPSLEPSKEGSTRGLDSAKLDLILPLFDRDWRLLDDFVMI